METRKWIYFSSAIAIVALFLFVFYKTRGSSGAPTTANLTVDSLFRPNMTPQAQTLFNQANQNGTCTSGCSFSDYSSMTSPVMNTLPYDMMYESQMSTLPLEPTQTPDPVVLLSQPEEIHNIY